MCLSTERSRYIHRNIHVLSALVVQHQRLDQTLILVRRQRSGKLCLHQRAFAAAITALADFQGVGSFRPPSELSRRHHAIMP